MVPPIENESGDEARQRTIAELSTQLLVRNGIRRFGGHCPVPLGPLMLPIRASSGLGRNRRAPTREFMPGRTRASRACSHLRTRSRWQFGRRAPGAARTCQVEIARPWCWPWSPRPISVAPVEVNIHSQLNADARGCLGRLRKGWPFKIFRGLNRRGPCCERREPKTEWPRQACLPSATHGSVRDAGPHGLTIVGTVGTACLPRIAYCPRDVTRTDCWIVRSGAA